MDYKQKRKVHCHSAESLEFMRNKNRPKQQANLDKLGYKSEKEYRDKVSYLAW